MAATLDGQRLDLTPVSDGDGVVRAARVPLYRRLYVQVLCAIAMGVALGFLRPQTAQDMKPFGDLFIKMIRMMIAPIIFSTVVVGIAKMGDLRAVARVGLRAILYFEIVSSLALVLGLIVANLYQPGAGLNVAMTSVDRTALASYTTAAEHSSALEFVMHVVPDSVVDAFASGNILQVLFFSILFGLALAISGDRARGAVDMIDQFAQGFFGVIRLIMVFAPLGAFGAMAFTIGKYGLGALHQLGMLMAAVYMTCALFIFGVLNLIARLAGFSLWRLLVYLREEIAIVFGTSTSESVLPRLMVKLERLGCEKSVVGLVVPTGYSFNLDGTSIYLSMATLFIAQAAHVHLGLGEQLGILGLLLLTSKGSAAVTGAGFITLAATLSSFPDIPIEGLALLLGVDRFMSEARALTNLIGNAVATVVVARWQGSVDLGKMRAALQRPRQLQGKAHRCD